MAYALDPSGYPVNIVINFLSEEKERKMKSQLRWAWMAAASLLLALGTTSAQAAIGSVVNSKHDFSATGPNATYKGAGSQVCIYCHAPHNNASAGSLLWNRALSAATYTLYTSTTLSATTMGQPGAVSKLCLSCHDGTIAIDSFGAATGTKMVAGTALLGSDLSNDHPIGFTYDAALVGLDSGLRAVTVAATIGAGNVGTIDTKLLVSGRMECSSCHDVHNSTSGTQVEAKLLKITTVGSALCTTCHIK